MHQSPSVVYNRHKVLELLFNLAWLVVAVSLWGLWLVRRCSVRKGSLLPALGAQVIALAILTAVLLPVISMTDDLHACQLPAEIRRSVVQSDQHLTPVAPPNVVTFALALLGLCMSLPDFRRSSSLAVEQPAILQMRGFFRSLWSRPPPVATA